MLEVCANYSGGAEEREVVQFLEEVTFELALKKCRAGVLKLRPVCPWGSPRPFQGVREVKTIYIVILRHSLSVLLCCCVY